MPLSPEPVPAAPLAVAYQTPYARRPNGLPSICRAGYVTAAALSLLQGIGFLVAIIIVGLVISGVNSKNMFVGGFKSPFVIATILPILQILIGSILFTFSNFSRWLYLVIFALMIVYIDFMMAIATSSNSPRDARLWEAIAIIPAIQLAGFALLLSRSSAWGAAKLTTGILLVVLAIPAVLFLMSA